MHHVESRGCGRATVKAVEGYCGSPIEKLMLAALLACRPHMKVCTIDNEFGEEGAATVLTIQPNVGFNADFLLDCRGVSVVIECDGYDYHHTRAHLDRDRKRDRDLQAAGYIVLRFTGSQLARAPRDCAKEALAFLPEEGPTPAPRGMRCVNSGAQT